MGEFERDIKPALFQRGLSAQNRNEVHVAVDAYMRERPDGGESMSAADVEEMVASFRKYKTLPERHTNALHEEFKKRL